MNILIDNKDLKDFFNITVLDYSAALGIAAERVNEREWYDKSGVDKNLANVRYDSYEFSLTCIAKADNEVEAYSLVKVLTDYMYEKGCFVLSLRDTVLGVRECFLCERSQNIVPSIHVRERNGLYQFKLGLKDVNPNALKFYNAVTGNATSIDYTKGQNAVLYWGDGDQGEVSNSGTYSKSDYAADGLVDIIVDSDANAEAITELTADFSADVTSGIKAQTVNFTDVSTGDVKIWSWDFGDGNTSSEQNPTHVYAEAGTFTVTLQIFNAVNGSGTETKTNYITIRSARILANDSGDFILANDSGDYILKN